MGIANFLKNVQNTTAHMMPMKFTVDRTSKNQASSLSVVDADCCLTRKLIGRRNSGNFDFNPPPLLKTPIIAYFSKSKMEEYLDTLEEIDIIIQRHSTFDVIIAGDLISTRICLKIDTSMTKEDAD